MLHLSKYVGELIEKGYMRGRVPVVTEKGLAHIEGYKPTRDEVKKALPTFMLIHDVTITEKGRRATEG